MYQTYNLKEPELNIVEDEQCQFNALTEKDKHLALLKTRFDLKCSHAIFNKNEIDILKKYGAWLEALYLHKINPITQKQIEFVESIGNGTKPTEEIAAAWYKYMKRIEIELTYGESLKAKYTASDNSFYSREDFYKVHKEKIRRA